MLTPTSQDTRRVYVWGKQMRFWDNQVAGNACHLVILWQFCNITRAMRDVWCDGMAAITVPYLCLTANRLSLLFADGYYKATAIFLNPTLFYYFNWIFLIFLLGPGLYQNILLFLRVIGGSLMIWYLNICAACTYVLQVWKWMCRYTSVAVFLLIGVPCYPKGQI